MNQLPCASGRLGILGFRAAPCRRKAKTAGPRVIPRPQVGLPGLIVRDTPRRVDRPPAASTYNHFDVYAANISADIRKGWISMPLPVTRTIPFCIVPGDAIPKPRQPEKFRVIANASVPTPRHLQIAIRTPTGKRIPVLTNATARLPASFSFTWASIDDATESILILARAAKVGSMVLRGRPCDYVKWFRQLATRRDEHWKSLLALLDQLWIDL